MFTSSSLRPGAHRGIAAKRAGIAAALYGFIAPSALAGPPLATDDPDTLDKGTFEFNTAYTLSLSKRDGDAGRSWEQEAPLMDLAYGLFEGVQVKFELPLVVLDPAGNEADRVGFGDASTGAKLRILTEEQFVFSISSYPAVGVPLGNRKLGLGTGNASLTLPLEIGRHLLDDTLFIYADAG